VEIIRSFCQWRRRERQVTFSAVSRKRINRRFGLNKVISVLIADDHPVVREGLAAILKSQKDVKVIAEATNGEEACELCEQLSPDVLLLDLRMPKKDGLQAITELMARGTTKPRIIVITTSESEEDIRRALKAGAKGYLLKGTAPQQIREAVRKVAAGESLLPANVASKLTESMAHPELSPRFALYRK
jgi:two-component system NarL family response regulator